jgi:hypothetical protein
VHFPAPLRRARAVSLVVVACALLGASATSAFAAAAPNPTLTPGVTDPGVTQGTIATTICTRGYTSMVRNVSTQTKRAVYVEYGIASAQQRGYVIDHLIPLEVGGANDIKNLWPQPITDAKSKDELENQMHTAVCAGRISLAEAQARFVTVAPESATPPVTTVTITLPPPTQTPPPTPGSGASPVVHPGAFCAPAGARGVTTAGTPMVCGPASDGRNRWHSG